MPALSFTARDGRGKTLKGLRVAESQGALAEAMAAEGLFLISAKPVATKERNKGTLRLNPKDLSILLLHLATYLEVGLPLMSALTDFRDPRRPHLERAVADMANRMYEGAALSEVMAAHAGLFLPVHVAMVRSGEASGRLDKALRAVIKLVEWDAAFRKQVRKAAAYPLTLLGVLTLVAVLVSIFAFPNILRLLTDLNIPLPMVTQVFLGLGEAMRRFGWLLLAIPLGFRLGLPYLLKRESIRLWWDTKILGLPLLGGLVIRMALSRFAHFLAEQYHAGIPLVQALRNSEAVTGNARLAFSIRTMASGVAQGTKLAVMAARLGYFPDLVVRMLAIGEETGKLEETLDRTAKHFDEEVTQGVNTAFMVLDPLIKVVMAGILVFVATAILLPLYSLMSGLNE